MKIDQVTVKRFKGALYLDLIVPPNVVELAGLNGAGKSSALDAIIWAFVGKRGLSGQPVRIGEKVAEVTVRAGGMQIARRITSSGKAYLKVTSDDGVKWNQGGLDTLVGDFTFDPEKFSRMKKDDQIQTVLDLVAPDLRKKIFLEAADLDKHRADRLVARRILDETGEPVPVLKAEPVDVAGLMDERRKLEQYNRDQDGIGARRQTAIEGVDDLKGEIVRKKQDIEADIARLADYQKELDLMPEAAARQELTTIDVKLDQANETNRQAGTYESYLKAVSAKAKAKEHWEDLDKIVKDGVKARRELIDSSDLPIPGVTFTSEGVFVDGVQFENLSSGEKIQTSALVGMAKNPKLRVMFVENAARLDEAGRQILADLAVEHDYQVWLERVGPGSGEDSFLIEDGIVVGQEPPEAADGGGDQ